MYRVPFCGYMTDLIVLNWYRASHTLPTMGGPSLNLLKKKIVCNHIIINKWYYVTNDEWKR